MIESSRNRNKTMAQAGESKSKPYDMAYHGHVSPLKALIDQNKQLITTPDENGRMLLHWAALGGHQDIVTHLLSLNVPVDPTDDMDMTPLILAASAGRENIVNILLKECANVNAKSSEGHSALQYAASKNWKAICVKLLEKEADINAADKRGATPLHRAASKGNIEIVNLFMDHLDSLNINQKDYYGNTALHLACEEDREDEAKTLTMHGADLEIRNKEKKTPLELCSRALAKKLTEIAEMRDN